jgi:hypothetical protein
MKTMVHERKLNRKGELHDSIFDATRRMNGPDVPLKGQIILNFKYLQLHYHSESDLCECDISDWE